MHILQVILPTCPLCQAAILLKDGASVNDQVRGCVVANTPINVILHLPKVGQRVGICRGLVTQIHPQSRDICNTNNQY